MNLYAYCQNNPILYIDKTGTKGKLEDWLTLVALAAASVALIALASVLTFGSATLLICGTMAAVGMGFLAGAGGSLVGQLVESGGDFAALDPVKAINAGVEVAVVSGICAACSITLGQVGLAIGTEIGGALSLYTVGGISFGQVFGGFAAVTAICEGIGFFIGTLAGGIIGEKIGNDIFGKESDFGTLLKNSFKSILEGWLNNIFDGLGGKPWEIIWRKLRQR